MKEARFSPKEFLRARRPERFSDAVVEEQATLDRAILEYHLDTITTRSQEVEFATFARHLAEREICPNLLPQTGPTGGGDSKVDSETYPVADDLSLGWFVGNGTQAASERWGFAFSAKKKWRGKVRSDVAKAVETRRDYRKIFFVSNQAIRDKDRAALEDESRANYGVDVRILDRTWILEKVFRNGHQTLAIEDLELGTSIRKQLRKGPLDKQRENDLEALERRIQLALQEQRLSFQLAEDCIDAADLARQLERPRAEIDGLFERAERMASKCGTDHQRLKCAYQKAWTTYWWHEDYEQFAKLYASVEDLAKGSRNAYELELLTNLWFLLHGAVTRGVLGEASAALQERSETLAKELDRLSQENDRPSTALQARTSLLLVQIYLKTACKESIDPVLRDLRDVVRKCEGLVGYPLDPLAKIVTEMGEILHRMPAYDELFETVVNLASARKGEVSAARMLLERGAQQLRADQSYDAMCTLGRVLRQLHKHESRHDLVRALYLCGCAYERVGLLWAARGTLLGAASFATAEFWTYGEVTRVQAACYRRLKWLELQLGRLPQILAWHEVDISHRSTLVAGGHDESELAHGEREFDLALGILLLKTDFWELKWLSRLPDVLERLSLPASSVALIYALGHEGELREDNAQALRGEDDPHAVALKWRDQPASDDLPTQPILYEERFVTLRSNVLGCRITVESENVAPCLELAESILAALESLLSTGTVDRIIAREPVLTMALRKSDFAGHPFEFNMRDDTGRPHLDIVCRPFDPHGVSKEEQAVVKERLVKLLCTVVAKIVMTDDPVQAIERLFREELALERSVDFTGSFVTIGNVLGPNPKSRVSNWSDRGDRDYPLKRSEAWDAGDPRAEKELESEAPGGKLTAGQGGPPEELLDYSRTKHTNIQNISLIRESLWEKARWITIVSATSADSSAPPILAPVFKDSGAARKIFSHWRTELGMRDTAERLRVAIVRGIDRTKPYSCRVLIGSNVHAADLHTSARYVTVASRIRRVDMASDTGLDTFLREYRKFGSYSFAPAFTLEEKFEPEIIQDQCVIKRELNVREAWEIGRHDPDSMAIEEEDTPIIPAGQENAPVIELLRWMHERSPMRPSTASGRTQKIGRNDLCPCGSGKKYKKCHGA